MSLRSFKRPICPQCGEPARQVLADARIRCKLNDDGTMGHIIGVSQTKVETHIYVCGGYHEWLYRLYSDEANFQRKIFSRWAIAVGVSKMSNYEKLDRFITQFKKEIIIKYGFNSESVKDQFLIINPDAESVELHAIIVDCSGDEFEIQICSMPHLFSTYDLEEDTVENLLNILDLEEEEIEKRVDEIFHPLGPNK